MRGQEFPNFTANGETVVIGWVAGRQTAHESLIVPPLVDIRATSGGFTFGISLSPDVALRVAAALVEGANAARTAPMTDDRGPA